MRQFIFVVLILFSVNAMAQGLGGGSAKSTRKLTSYPLNRSGNIEAVVCSTSAGCPKFWIDFSQDPSGATITSNDDTGYVLTKNGSPARVEDGTHPDGINLGAGYSHKFTSADSDWWERADDGAFEEQDFSVMCAIVPFDVSGTKGIISKDDDGGNQLWNVKQVDDDLAFTIWSSVTDTTLIKTSTLKPNALHFFTVTYDYSGAGYVNDMAIYFENRSPVTVSNATGPLDTVTVPLQIGAYNDANEFDGYISFCAYFDFALTQEQHDKAHAKYRGMCSTRGCNTNFFKSVSDLTGYIMLANPDSGVEPYMVLMPISTTQVTPYGMCGQQDQTNLIKRSLICESVDGSDDPVGWTDTDTAGDGSADGYCDEDAKAAGQQSWRCDLTGTTSSCEVVSQCSTASIGSTVYLQAHIKGTAGTEDIDIALVEWTNADCTGTPTTTNLINGEDPGTDWEIVRARHTSGSWQGGTNSWHLKLLEQGNGGTSAWVDAPSVATKPAGMYFCGGDTDTTTFCADVYNKTVNPLLASEAYTVTANVRYSSSDVAAYAVPYQMSATTSNYNLRQGYIIGTTLYSQYRDAGGTSFTSSVSGLSVDTEFEFKCAYTPVGGRGVVCRDGTCDASPLTGAYLDGVNAELNVASSSSSGYNVCVKDFKLERGYHP